MTYVTLVPTNGRDYKSKKAVLEDWNENKDFLIQCIGHPYDGKPINKQDAQTQPGTTYNIRYDRLMKVLPIAV